MDEIKIKKLNESLYITTLNNGFKIILYPTTKSKNFYVTLTTRFGANILKYKRGNKITEIYPGTAHFLEHKVMGLEDEKQITRLESLGSSPNAYTTFYGTTYNIYGSQNILKNIEVIFDAVFNFKVADKSIENEKKIISEEIDMGDDDVYIELNKIVNDNLFTNSAYKNQIVGKKEDINKIDKKYLNYIYKSFYNSSNMFSVITGNFNVQEVEEFIVNYINKLNDKKTNIKIIKQKDTNNIINEYVEKEGSVEIDKVCLAYKINLNNFSSYTNREVTIYYNLMLDSLFSSTSEFLNKLKKEEIIESGISSIARIYDNFVVIKIITNTNKYKEFIKRTKNLLKNIKIDEQTFERKKKNVIASFILEYEDIEELNDLLTHEELIYKKIDNKIYDLLNNLNYDDFIKIINTFQKNSNVVGRLYKSDK